MRRRKAVSEPRSGSSEPERSEIHLNFGIIGRVIRMIFRHPARISIAIGAAVVAAILQLMIPRFIGQAVNNADHLLAGNQASGSVQQALITTGLLLFATSVFRGLFTMFYNYQGEAASQVLGYELRLAYYRKLQELSFSYYDHVHTGDLMTRGMLDITGVRMFVTTGLLRTVVLTILIGFGAYTLLATNLTIGLLSLSFVPIVGWRAVVTRLRLRQSWMRLQERLSTLTRVMEENLAGIRVVRAFAGQMYEMGKFDHASMRALRMTRHRIGLQVRNGTFMTFAYYVSMLLVLWVGGGLTVQGTITVGQLAEFLAYMTILQMPVRQIGLMVNSYARTSTTGARLFSVLDREPTITSKRDAPPLEVEQASLRFDHVSFTFERTELPALEDISFEAPAGTTVGIVGPPGSGKSTIAQLIPRFYDVSAGKITIDGQDIREITVESLRQVVSVVQQDSFIFTASIENNVAYGDPWAEDDQITAASQQAQLHPYISRLAGGYGTLIGERGVSLSGGQRQRLAISRSLLLAPPIIVLDDSTASVDAATERRILETLEHLAPGRVIVIISHRLSTLMHADQIIFLDRGRIVERGTHRELLAEQGRYYSLYRLQSDRGDGVTEGGTE